MADAETLLDEKLNAIAASLFKEHGLSFDTARRAGGWTNGVWLNEGLALRLSKEKDSDRLHRESLRCQFLSPTVGYPATVATGRAQGHEWCLSRRVPGVPLGDVWQNLPWPQKARAVKEIVDIALAVHATDPAHVAPVTKETAWYSGFDREATLKDIQNYVAGGHFAQGQGLVLGEILDRFHHWHRGGPLVLCHGDITVDNLLWHEGHVTSLLDFEHAVMAPSVLDIHSLVNLALNPVDENDSSDLMLLGAKGLGREGDKYVADMVSLFRPMLPGEREAGLLMGYNLYFRLRFFQFWLEDPRRGYLGDYAYQKLLSLCDGKGGYLAGLLQ